MKNKMTFYIEKILNENKDRCFSVALGIILALAVITVGIYLRLSNLSIVALDFHEYATYIIAKQQHLNLTIICSAFDNTPPLFQIITHCMLKLKSHLGINILLRSTSLASGILAIFFMGYFLLKDFGKKSALLGVTFQSLLLQQVQISRYARSDALIVLLATISFFLWLRLYRRNSNIDDALFFGVSLLLLYTHYFSLPFFLLQAGAVLFGKKILHQKYKQTLCGILATLSLYSPWFILYVAPRIFSNETFWISPPSITEFVQIFSSVIDSYNIELFIFFVIFYVGAVGIFKRDFKKFKLEFFLAIFIVLFISMIWVKSIMSTSVFLSRYFVILSPIFLFLIIRMLMRFPHFKLLYIVLCILMLRSAYVINRDVIKPATHLRKENSKPFSCPKEYSTY